MKNIQVIDGALNCTFSIFQATDEEFALLFPEPGQEIQFAEDLFPESSGQEDLADLPAQEEEVGLALGRIWERPIRKRDAQGIHGTLFYGLERYSSIYREKREDGVGPSDVNAAQRCLFGIGPLRGRGLE